MHFILDIRMKKYLIALLNLIIVFSLCISCSSHGSTHIPGKSDSITDGETYPKDAIAVITFDEVTHNFGKINAGEKVTYAFKFKNTGNAPLIISYVNTTCGCTVSSYPKTPVKPGEGAAIDVSFDSEGKQGFQSKTIIVNSNAHPSSTSLRIESQVLVAEEK